MTQLHRNIAWSGFFLLVVFIVYIVFHKAVKTDDQVHETSSTKLKITTVSAHLNAPIDGTRNIIWCATMQLAWNKLVSINNTLVHLDAPSATVDNLNERQISTEDIPEDSYLVHAGPDTKETCEFIEKTATDRFHGEAPDALLSCSGNKDWLIIFAYLFRTLSFPKRFDEFTSDCRFQNAETTCFGRAGFSDRDPLASQIAIYDYRNRNDFVIELNTEQADDRLILAKISPEKDLKTTISSVESRIHSKTPTHPKRHARLTIPKINFDLVHAFNEIQGRTIHGRGATLQGMPIDEAKQRIRFKLDESGAVLESEALLRIKGHTEDIVFDRPFLILLKKRGRRWPYLAIWIQNDELFVSNPASEE